MIKASGVIFGENVIKILQDHEEETRCNIIYRAGTYMPGKFWIPEEIRR